MVIVVVCLDELLLLLLVLCVCVCVFACAGVLFQVPFLLVSLSLSSAQMSFCCADVVLLTDVMTMWGVGWSLIE